MKKIEDHGNLATKHKEQLHTMMGCFDLQNTTTHKKLFINMIQSKVPCQCNESASFPLTAPFHDLETDTK